MDEIQTPIKRNRGSFAKGNKEGYRFKKGDPLINRNGRPRSFDQLRKLIKDIASEPVGKKDLTRIEQMLLKMATSRNANDRRLFLEYGFGKVKDELDINDQSISDDERANRITRLLDSARARRTGQPAPDDNSG